MQWRPIVLASVLAAGCIACASRDTTPTQPSPPAWPPSGSCDHTKVQWTVGQPASDDLLERARAAAGAKSARFLRPNQPVTLEYLGSRLNLGLDARDIVRSVACG
jgi:hypothetical protein